MASGGFEPVMFTTRGNSNPTIALTNDTDRLYTKILYITLLLLRSGSSSSISTLQTHQNPQKWIHPKLANPSSTSQPPHWDVQVDSATRLALQLLSWNLHPLLAVQDLHVQRQVHPLPLVVKAAPVWPERQLVAGEDGGNEAYQRLLRSELFGSDFDSFGSPAGGGGQVASPISPSKNMLRFKTEHSGPNSPYSPSRCTAPTSPRSSPPPPTTPTVSSPPPPKTPSTPTTTKSPPPPKSPSTTPSTSPSSSSLDTGVIVGIAIGAVAILVVLSLCCIFCSKKKRRREEPGYYVPPPPPPTGPK